MTQARNWFNVQRKHYKGTGALLFSLLLSVTNSIHAQNISGRILTAKDTPLSFANVMLLQQKDSSFICGTVSGEDGDFILKDSIKSGLLKISAIGYKTVYQPYLTDKLNVIRMEEDSKTLGEVVVKSSLPKTTLRNGGMITTVAGSVLEKTGNMMNLLNRIPSVTMTDGEIEVFGRGKPDIYINGRKMRDKMELERLQPDEIKSVEVITTPGARYDANVKSVIRIVTKRKQGEGFGVDTKTDFMVNEQGRTSEVENLRLSYQSGGWDMDAQMYGAYRHIQDNKQLRQLTYLAQTWNQTSNITQEHTQVNPYARMAASYTWNERHSTGGSLSYNRYARYQSIGDMLSSSFRNIDPFEKSANRMYTSNPSTDLTANLYYVGKVGKIGIDFNTDWYWAGRKSRTRNEEEYQTEGEAVQEKEIHSTERTYNQLLASKLILSMPLFHGDFSVGGEYSHSWRRSRYNVLPANLVDDEQSTVREGMASTFIEYDHRIGNMNTSIGLRYERVNFDYFDHGKRIPGQSKIYGNWFPSLSLDFPVGKTQMQLSYSSDIYRSSYHELRNGVQYDNRYTYESGNPFLTPSIMRNASYTLSWKWLTFSTIFTHISDEVCTLIQTYKDNPQISLMRPENMPSYNNLQASVALSPKFGCWNPALEMTLFKQWFHMDTHEGESLDHPVGAFQLTNTFDTKWLTASIIVTAQTEGNMGNKFVRKGYFNTDISLYKALCKGKLILQLYAQDLFHTANQHRIFYSGKQRTTYFDADSSSSLTFTVQYKFNTSHSKYKGTGAGKEQKSRM